MPKSKNSFYAVKRGRDGPAIYDSWPECEAKVSGFSGARHKSFATRAQAEAWLQDDPERMLSPFSQNYSQAPSSQGSASPAPSASHPNSSLPESQPPPLPENEGEPVILEDAVPVDYVDLSPDQIEILEMVEEGKSLFFTGSAGTGKSVLLREIIQKLRLKHGFDGAVAVTASTGIAGLNIGGSTLHSFAGIGLGKEHENILLKRLQKPTFALARWMHCRVLIIDEISMIDGILFDKLEYIARNLRNDGSPFGGIQLVITGDFFQLPPVPDKMDGVPLPITYAFEAETWNKCIPHIKILTEVFRQKNRQFVDILNKMREGHIADETAQTLINLSRPLNYPDGIEPTQLFPLRTEVEKANNSRLEKLPLPAHTYIATDWPGHDSKMKPISREKAKRLLNDLVTPPEISLRVGAQVMLTQNLVQGRLVNGSLGKVIGFDTTAEATRDHIEVAKIDTATAKNAVKPKIEGVDEEEEDNGDGKDNMHLIRWPVVQFEGKDKRYLGQKLLLTPAGFSVVNVRGIVEAQRDQVPLILAWALSIHKSQGQTLQRVKVDLDRIFEKGQAYVALSRATSMDTLQVLHFNKSKVMAHPRVLAWNRRMLSLPPPTQLDVITIDVEPNEDDFDFDWEDSAEAYHGSISQ